MHPKPIRNREEIFRDATRAQTLHNDLLYLQVLKQKELEKASDEYLIKVIEQTFEKEKEKILKNNGVKILISQEVPQTLTRRVEQKSLSPIIKQKPIIEQPLSLEEAVEKRLSYDEWRCGPREPKEDLHG